MHQTGTPLVSVIVPAYDVTDYIGDALNSVLAQTFTDYEIIVINDGSPDTEALERALPDGIQPAGRPARGTREGLIFVRVPATAETLSH